MEDQISLTTRCVLAAAVSAALGLPTTAAAQEQPIQPGMPVIAELGCTLGYVYDGLGPITGKTYISTSAHCVAGKGQAVMDGDEQVFGRVAFLPAGGYADAPVGTEDPSPTPQDFALIEIYGSALPRVNPSVAGIPEAPAGLTAPGDVATGDQILFSGSSTAFYTHDSTREPRSGTLKYQDDEDFAVVAPITGGDSGGPIIEAATGRAIGTFASTCAGADVIFRPDNDACPGSEGPTTGGTLAKAAAAGMPVRLRLAHETQPPPPLEPDPSAAGAPSGSPVPSSPTPAPPAITSPPPARIVKLRVSGRIVRFTLDRPGLVQARVIRAGGGVVWRRRLEARAGASRLRLPSLAGGRYRLEMRGPDGGTRSAQLKAHP
jgi:hypothetical protein